MKRKIPKNKRYKSKEKNNDVKGMVADLYGVPKRIIMSAAAQEQAEEFIMMQSGGALWHYVWTTTPTGRLIVDSENNR